jgi:hypothetical protein
MGWRSHANVDTARENYTLCIVFVLGLIAEMLAAVWFLRLKVMSSWCVWKGKRSKDSDIDWELAAAFVLTKGNNEVTSKVSAVFQILGLRR